MCALFISGEHEKWSKEVWNCRRAGWLHSAWARWFVSSFCRAVWAEKGGGLKGQRDGGWRGGGVPAPILDSRFFFSSNSCASLTRGRQQHRERGCLGQMDQHHLPNLPPSTPLLLKSPALLMHSSRDICSYFIWRQWVYQQTRTCHKVNIYTLNENLDVNYVKTGNWTLSKYYKSIFDLSEMFLLHIQFVFSVF